MFFSKPHTTKSVIRDTLDRIWYYTLGIWGGLCFAEYYPKYLHSASIAGAVALPVLAVVIIIVWRVSEAQSRKEGLSDQ
jgi:hypothetical protein